MYVCIPAVDVVGRSYLRRRQPHLCERLKASLQLACAEDTVLVLVEGHEPMEQICFVLLQHCIRQLGEGLGCRGFGAERRHLRFGLLDFLEKPAQLSLGRSTFVFCLRLERQAVAACVLHATQGLPTVRQAGSAGFDKGRRVLNLRLRLRLRLRLTLWLTLRLTLAWLSAGFVCAHVGRGSRRIAPRSE